MSATRTQVYLTEEQRRRIDELAAVRGVTLAEVVRSALDEYLDNELPDSGPILAATFGVAPQLSPPNRDEWDRG